MANNVFEWKDQTDSEELVAREAMLAISKIPRRTNYYNTLC